MSVLLEKFRAEGGYPGTTLPSGLDRLRRELAHAWLADWRIN